MNTIELDKGIYRTPSAGVDGELEYCMNLMPVKGEMMNTPRLEDTGVELPNGVNLMAVHKTSDGTTNHVFTRNESNSGWARWVHDNTESQTLTLTIDRTNKTWSLPRQLISMEYIIIQISGTYTERTTQGVKTVEIDKQQTIKPGDGTLVGDVYQGNLDVPQLSTVKIVREASSRLNPGTVLAIIGGGVSKPKKKPAQRQFINVEQTVIAYQKEEEEPYAVVIKVLPSQVTEIKVLGNTLVISADKIYYALWRDGAYVWLGSQFPKVDIRFALEGTYKTILSEVKTEVQKGTSGESVVYETVHETVQVPSLSEYFDWTFSQPLEPNTYYKIVCPKGWISVAANANYAAHATGEGESYYITTKENPVASVRIFFIAGPSKTATILKGSTAENIAFAPIEEDYGQANCDVVMGAANQFIKRATENNMFACPFLVRYALRLYDGTFVNPSAPCLLIPCDGTTPLMWSDLTYPDHNNPTPAQVFADGIWASIQYRILNTEPLSGWKDLITDIVIGVTEPIYRYNQGARYSNTEGFPAKIRQALGTVTDRYDDVVRSKFVDAGNTYGAVTVGQQTYTGKNQLETFHNIINGSISHMQFVMPKFEDGKVIEDISGKSNFHIIKKIKIEDVETMDTMQKLELDEGALNGLAARTVIKDNPESLIERQADVVNIYNNRVTIANITEYKFPGWTPSLMNGDAGRSGITPTIKYALIKYKEQGRSYDLVKVDGWAYGAELVSWFAYPSANAVEAELYAKKGETYYMAALKLERHKTMDLAYWFNMFRQVEWTTVSQQDWTDRTQDSGATVTYPNKVAQTEPLNPFTYPASLQNTVGSGNIIALAANTQALSQGQFGQHPMFAFTDEGIWALTVAGNGQYASVQPISRDVITNPNSVTQTDNAIFFAAEQGLKVIQGGETRTIAEQMEGVPFNGIQLRNILSGFDDQAKEEAQTWNDILKTAIFAYDYANRLLHIYPETPLTHIGWHYIVSTETMQVTAQEDPNVRAVLQAYPSTLVSYDQDEATHVATYGKPQDFSTTRRGILLTRPCALSNPFQMKTITDMRAVWRKYSSDPAIKIALFVSNDRLVWHRLNSLRQHSFKWYRFAVLTSFTDAERLTGIAVETQTRRENKIR